MEATLSYIILAVGWPMLILGSIWTWKHSAHLKGTAKTFLNVSVASFYLLAYACTMYLTDQPWLLGVIPVFIFFSALMTIIVITVSKGDNHK